MHAKTFLIDDIGAAVSTLNLDNRSLRLNFELTALVADPVFARQVEAMFEQDFANSKQVKLSDLADKPLWFHLAVRSAYLFAPVL
jgi:cardiolipin synthase